MLHSSPRRSFQVIRLFNAFPHYLAITCCRNGTTPLGTRLEMLLLQYMDDIENWKEANSKGQARGPEPKKRSQYPN